MNYLTEVTNLFFVPCRHCDIAPGFEAIQGRQGGRRHLNDRATCTELLLQ